MVVKHKGNQEYEGLAADTKPTAANTAVNATFRETDTDNEFTNNGTSWLQTDPSAYSYIIYKQGTTYYAKSKNLTNYSGTNAQTVIRSAMLAMGAAGGGTAFIRNGEYIFPNSGTPLDAIENTHWVGESRDQTILRNQHASYGVFHRIGLGAVPTFSVRNLTVQTETDAAAVYIGGSKDCVFENCRFKRTIVPSVWSFITFFDDVSKTRTHQRMRVHNNIWEGSTLGQDMCGGGEYYDSSFENNTFIGGDGQGIAVTTSTGCSYSNNYFLNVGSNPIGLENLSQANVIHDNILINCGGFIKITYNIANELAIGNSIRGNRIFYGDSGIQDYAGRYELIEGNFIYRTKHYGILCALDHSTIANNQMVETNYSNSTITIGGTPYKHGGIMLHNNTNFTTNVANRIYGNLVRSGQPSFVIPTGYIDGGATATGFADGIIADSNNLVLFIHDNDIIDTYNRLIYLGTVETLFNNRGYVTENGGTATIGAAAMSVAVNHGLHITPVLHHILVTPSNNTTNAIRWWISTPTATQFTINLSGVPGASTATFVWRASRNT